MKTVGKRLMMVGAIMALVWSAINAAEVNSDHPNKSKPWLQYKKNTDESKVGKYTLPELMVTNDGRQVNDAEMWWSVRRPEILEMFQSHMFGRMPSAPESVTAELVSKFVSDGIAYSQVTLHMRQGDAYLPVNVLQCLPADATGPVPVFIGMNFDGNHTVIDDPRISIVDYRLNNRSDYNPKSSYAKEETRGTLASRWQIKDMINRGYGFITICRENFAVEDKVPNFKNGAHLLFPRLGKPDDWGMQGAWAWGYSRIVDYIFTSKEFDPKRIAIYGISRLGKAALWAAAWDQRISMVVSGVSGKGGTSLWRRNYGQRLIIVNKSFPGWFCDRFKDYNDNETALPFDQHMLLALIAPRPIFIATAAEDSNADNVGSFVAATYANPVFKLLGTDGFGAKVMPGVEKLIQTTIAWYTRPGNHGASTAVEWKNFLDFADRHFNR